MIHRATFQSAGWLFAALLFVSASVSADWRDDIGHTALVTELTAAMIPIPNGTGIEVAMAEAGSQSPAPPAVPVTITYLPNTASVQFSGKTFISGSGPNTGSDGHATGVANFFFGNTTSVAPGVTNVTGYWANDWINNGTGAVGGLEPIAHTGFQVINHSWVVRRPAVPPVGFDAAIVEIAQRIDHLVNRDNVLVIGGTDNGAASAVPELNATSYNAISVGLSNGNHGAGTTTIYGAGRRRPDIVAPATATSSSTPMVSSVATMLYDFADNSPATAGAMQTESMRAILMAGATKNEFASWDRTTTRPIDELYGAGELNAYNSYQIIAGGEQEGALIAPPTAVGDFGYDFVTATDFAALERNYLFEVGPGQAFDELSIFLQWNIDVGDSDPTLAGFMPTVNLSPGGDLANLNMFFYDSSNFLLDSSVSMVDNFEHLYFTGLTSGTYRLQITGDRADDFGLAWRTVAAVPEPGGWAAILFLFLGAWLKASKRFRWRFKFSALAARRQQSKTSSQAAWSNVPVVENR